MERLLAQNLGAEPSAEIRALAEAVRERATGEAMRALVAAPASPGDPFPDAPGPADGNLPLQLTRFFGRTGEIARLWELLQRSEERLITLTGPGGSGKTRLALAVAERLLAVWPGSIWYVPLVDLMDARLIGEKVLVALRLPRNPRIEPLEQVLVCLAQRSPISRWCCSWRTLSTCCRRGSDTGVAAGTRGAARRW